MKFLVTGAAGFIGSMTAERLCQEGIDVVGIDNINDYYDPKLKHARLSRIDHPLFRFQRVDITDRNAVEALFNSEQFDRVIHLAAQAGVRYSLENPHTYADTNIGGYLNILEACRNHNVEHLVYASSSSVYGLNAKVPLSTADSVDHPVSLYAATKKSNELMSHCYSHLYQLPTTGLRFFTVYGPWGRPDMAPFIFTEKMINGEEIHINNNGDMWRDFTYIDDIVEGIYRISNHIPEPNTSWSVENGSPSSSSAPYAVYNIGHGKPINLMHFVNALENELGIEANKVLRGMQPGDVYQTYADTKDLFAVTGYQPKVSLGEGVARFVSWYKSVYSVPSP